MADSILFTFSLIHAIDGLYYAQDRIRTFGIINILRNLYTSRSLIPTGVADNIFVRKYVVNLF